MTKHTRAAGLGGLLVCLVCISLCQGSQDSPFVPSPQRPWRMHTLFSTECQLYFDWQTVGLMHSLRKSGHPGPVTRLLSCTDDALVTYKGMDLAPTVVVPSMSFDPVTNDWYPAINKPAGVVHWLNHSPDAENVDWVLILDADMVVRAPILPWEVGAEIGRPASASYGYLIGCDNELATLHTKHPELCDKVGGFIMMHVSDLRKMAPLWLSKTQEVRADKAHWRTNITGDIYEKGWISEMYGYSFGAAEVGLRHKVNDTLMIYPGYIPMDGVEPQLFHYGLRFDVGEWHFSKLEYHEDNIVYDCNRLFPPPPFPEQVIAMESDVRKRRALLLSVECVNTINEGLILVHRLQGCPRPKKSPYLTFLAEDLLQKSSVFLTEVGDLQLAAEDGGLEKAGDGEASHTAEVQQLPSTTQNNQTNDAKSVMKQDKKPAANVTRPKIHTLFSVECSMYFDWQTVGMVYSFTLSRQPGPLTRLLSCTEEELKTYKGIDLAASHVVPSMSRHPLTGDWYPAINKPAAVLHWLNHVETDAEYIVILDADMILRGPITPWELGAAPGHPVSAPYDYLIGCDNELAKLHTRYPKACQKVGGVIVMHIDDLRVFAPLWLHKTEEVRADRAHWSTNLTGDIYGEGWISEMYGYVFGAAEVKLKHIINQDIMLYPGYVPSPGVEPRVLHYGLEWKIGNWSFDKAEWRYKDMTNNCWQFFPEPPDVATLNTTGEDEFRRDSICVECVNTLNEALYFHHKNRGCPEDQDDQDAEEKPTIDQIEAAEHGDLSADSGVGDQDQTEEEEQEDLVGETEQEKESSYQGHHDTLVASSKKTWSPPADPDALLEKSVKYQDSNSSFEARTGFLEHTRIVPVHVSYWKVAVWTLVVSGFLLIVSTVSRHRRLDQRRRQKVKLEPPESTDSSPSLGIPVSSEPGIASSSDRDIP